jgi:hypothetical protein
MECRICKQPISFVKGTRPGQSRKATVAVHDSELSQALADLHGEVVTPHPGSQRKLRLELEHSHHHGQEASRPKMEGVADESKPTALPAPQPAIPKSEIPGAEVINQPAAGQSTGADGEQTDEQRDARRSASY